jgi:capsular polysaccharide export protein
VVTSQLGFEALLCEKPVTCFGAPFYAGWGLTEDRVELPRRRARRSLEEVFAAAYMLYARYVDPDTGGPCEIERVIDHLALQRALFAKNRGTIIAFGFRRWKQGYVRAYLRGPECRVEFPKSPRRASELAKTQDAVILSWGQPKAAARRLAGAHGLPIWRMEDGFLRSVGLGSDLEVPASLVVDREGIYYDPTRPSELERILEEADFSAEELLRARALREQIVRSKLSKYNVGRPLKVRPPPGAQVVLVPGQVPGDQSIRLGCRDLSTNLALLREVRRRRPEAFLLYKPHPDVVSGNRQGDGAAEEIAALCDHIETEATIASCLDLAHEVHTLTSLVGFEGLLRTLPVSTYGQPFYAGWGLTDDRHPLPRRTRARSLDELVAAALIRYPRYLNHETGRFTTPERVIEQLVAARGRSRHASRIAMPRAVRQLQRLVRAMRGTFHAP